MITTLKEYETELEIFFAGYSEYKSRSELNADTLGSVLDEYESKCDAKGWGDNYVNQNYDDLSDEGGFYPSEIGEE